MVKRIKVSISDERAKQLSEMIAKQREEFKKKTEEKFSDIKEQYGSLENFIKEKNLK
jgi:hypothetical protein